MTDHDDATRALAEAWHRAWHSSRGKYDPCRDEALDIEPANHLLAALAESGHGIAPLSVIEAGEALPLAVETLTIISELSDATEQSSFREEAWAAMETLEPLAEAVRAALRADR